MSDESEVKVTESKKDLLAEIRRLREANLNQTREIINMRNHPSETVKVVHVYSDQVMYIEIEGMHYNNLNVPYEFRVTKWAVWSNGTVTPIINVYSNELYNATKMIARYALSTDKPWRVMRYE